MSILQHSFTHYSSFDSWTNIRMVALHLIYRSEKLSLFMCIPRIYVYNEIFSLKVIDLVSVNHRMLSVTTPLSYPTSTNEIMLSTHLTLCTYSLIYYFWKNYMNFSGLSMNCSRECYFEYQTRSQNKNSHDVDNILINRVYFSMICHNRCIPFVYRFDITL